MLGLRILENPHLLATEHRTVSRTLKERFLSWPWRPWQKTKVITVYVPSRDVIRINDPLTGDPVLVCHPETADFLRARLAESKPDFNERAGPWRH